MSSRDESMKEGTADVMPEPAPVIAHASEVDRRSFLKSAGGLLLAMTFEMGARGKAMAAAAGATSATVATYVAIGSDESVTVFVGGGEMGQGIYSGLAQGLAEDLMVDWTKVSVQPIPAALSWITGGSTGIMRRLQTLRYGGAAARQMLLTAAAQTWGIAVTACTASKGVVSNVLNANKLTYGQLAPLAATVAVPVTSTLTLVPNNAFKVIGQPVLRPDLPSKVNGRAVYGIDVRVPGMVFAAVKHCPVIGGTLASKPAVPSGAQAVVPLYDTSGTMINAVAVVASNTWAAKNAASNLSVSWKYPTTRSSISSSTFATQAQQLLAGTAPYVVDSAGDVNTAMSTAVRKLDLQYNLPYLAHACMEVLNCTVRINTSATGTTAEIWAPTQAPAAVQQSGATLLNIPTTSVTVYPTLMGGGLGRKIEQDYIGQAIQVAKAIGKPVKLTWTREEDMQHDMYRPMAVSRIQIGIDQNGTISAWNNRIVAPSLSLQRGRTLPATGDGIATEGSGHRPYNLPNRFVDYAVHPSPVPVGYWRSVGNSINIFAVESAVDEAAALLKVDPLAFRRLLLTNSTDPLAARTLTVLNAAAALGGWGTPVTAGRARGIALSNGFGSIVAEVVEISIPTAGTIKVHSVACAIDCGYAVNPNSVEAQMQGGIIHGLNAALWGQVTFSNGTPNVRNFSNCRVMRLKEAPVMNVQIVNTNGPLGGTGEAAVPPVAPALANAFAALTGTRIRSLPFFPGATMGEIG